MSNRSRSRRVLVKDATGVIDKSNCAAREVETEGRRTIQIHRALIRPVFVKIVSPRGDRRI